MSAKKGNKTGIFICARLGSTRLERKHLIQVKGREIESYLVERINHAFAEEIKSGEIFPVITTGNPMNNMELQEKIPEIKVFYGNDENIPLRQLEAALAFDIDYIVSVDGDDILCSVDAMRKIRDALVAGAEYAYTKGLPLGMNAFGYTRDFLESSLRADKGEKRATGWTRIFNDAKKKEIPIKSKDEPYLRFTLDYYADFAFFRALLEHPKVDLLTITDKDLVDLVLEEKIYENNRSIAEEYWVNFNQKVAEEK